MTSKQHETAGKYFADGPSPLAAAAATEDVQDVAANKQQNRLSANSSLLSPPMRAPSRSVSPAGSSRSPVRPYIDLSFLLRPSLYESISTDSALPPFTAPSHQPPADTPLDSLVAGCHFRQAATKAASELCAGSVPLNDHRRILQIFQIRLSCLILIGQTSIAANEGRALSDYLSRNTRPGQPNPAVHVPWDLRLLLHRLESRASADGRRSIMALYALGSEARAYGAAATEERLKALWQERLVDIGLRVAAELIEMNELDTAAQHLAELPASTSAHMQSHKALLQMRIGDVEAAGRTLGDAPSDGPLKGLAALARGNYAVAVEAYAALHAAEPENALITNNYAVCLLYVGRMDEATRLLDSLVDNRSSAPPSGALFNLATFYELASERAIDKKVRLVERVANRGMADGGWERIGTEFKL